VIQVATRHRFEAAHRLPQLGGKCAGIHGHSWHATVWYHRPGELPPSDTVADLSALKQAADAWIDANLDHHCLLGPGDPLVAVLPDYGCPVRTVYAWPTVESVAALIGEHVAAAVHPLGVFVAAVDLAETDRNQARWVP
jgi:6-pyruvoyltetrahydropterin/6-carboxytetrahydropterin synthase